MKKWMIINPGHDSPMQVWEYIDDVNEAMKIPYVADYIRKYGIKDSMPIVMNNLGGFHTHKPTKHDVVSIVERHTKPLISVYRQYPYNSRAFRTGWISPDCNTFSCDYMGHLKLAVQITEELYGLYDCATPDDELFERGWIKVSNKRAVFNWDKITDKQAERLQDWGISTRYGGADDGK